MWSLSKKRICNKYCIILSNSYKGTNRFNSYCEGDGCEKRTWLKKYFYKKFIFKSNYLLYKKYVDQKDAKLLNKYHNNFIEFSNSYYKEKTQGISDIVKSKSWDYILFFKNVKKLEPVYKY